MKYDDSANPYGLDGNDLKKFQEVNDMIIKNIKR